MRRARFLLSILSILLPCASAAAAELTVHVFDVGQGDSILVVSPAGKTVLVDAGPPDHAKALAKRVKALVAAPIDLLLMTHAHADHLGGMKNVLKTVGARIFMEPGFDHPSPLYSELLRELEARKIPLKIAEAGRRVDLGGGATLRILAPETPFLRGTRSDVNANSVVAHLSYGETSFYLSGDSERETEERILHSGEPISSSVYKVAHHGGRHSSSRAILEKIRPRIAAISVGAHNDYKHPAAQTIRRLEAVHARILRTDLEGELILVSDGKRVTVVEEHQ